MGGRRGGAGDARSSGLPVGRVSRRRKSSSDVREWGRDLPCRGAQRGLVRFGCDTGESQGRPGGFKQRGPRSSSAAPTREGRPQAVGSEAEGRGTLPIGTSPVGARLLIPHHCPGAAASHVGPNSPQRVIGSPRPPAPALVPMPSPHPTTALSGTVSPGNEPRGGGGHPRHHRTRAALRRAGRGTPGTGQAGRGGGEKGHSCPRSPVPRPRPAAVSHHRGSRACGAGVPAAPPLRHRLVPWLNASPRKISPELLLP